MRSVVTLAICVFLSACQTVPPQDSRVEAAQSLFRTVPRADFTAPKAQVTAAATPAAAVAAKQKLSQVENDEIAKLLQEAYTGCGAVMGGLATEAKDGERQAFWLQMSGLLFGSVLGPAATAANAVAHRAFIAAASGWAGATNLAGQFLRVAGLAGDAAAQTRNQIATAFKANIVEALDSGKTYDERRNAVLKAKGECIWYAINVPGSMPPLPSSGAAGGGGGK